MRQGDFSNAYSASGILQTVFDPSTTMNSANCPYIGKANPYCRTPFPSNQIPIGEESPTAKILYDLMPQPTSSANPLVARNLSQSVRTFQVMEHTTFRLDHVFNGKNRAYLRFSDGDTSTNISNTGRPFSVATDGFPAGAGQGYQNSPITSIFPGIGYTHIFSPTFFSETILGQQWQNSKQLLGTGYTTDFEAKLGLPNNFGEPGFPATFGLINNFTSSQTDTLASQIITSLDENLTKLVGHHQLYFGGRFKHDRMADLPQGLADYMSFHTAATGIYDTSSGNNYSVLNNAGFADASYFLGSASAYGVNLEPPHDHYHENEVDAYIQDDYHFKRNLTFNLGLRYEAHPAVWNKYGLMNSFDFKNDAEVLSVPASTLIAEGYTTQAIITNDKNIGVKFETPEEAGMPAALLKNYNFNFLPRIGFSWQPLDKAKFGTVIRGGLGQYDFQTSMQEYLNHPQKNNPLSASYLQSYMGADQAIDGLPNELLRYNDPAVFGVMGVNTSGVVNSTTVNSILPGITLWSDSPDWRPMLVTEANVTVEQPLKGNSVFRVSYVFTDSKNLDIAYLYNNHPSYFQWEMAHGMVPPTGGVSVIGTPLQNTYAATATGPYDQTTWGGGSAFHTQDGWSNDNSLQLNYQRLFNHGVAYQVYYVFSRVMAAGGDQQESFTGGTLAPYANYPAAMGAVATLTSPYGTMGPRRVPPPAPPTGTPIWQNYHALTRWALYTRDTTIPYHHVQFNGVVDLPFGRGKRFFGNTNRFVDELIGGFELAGNGGVVSRAFGAPGGFGPVNPIQVYKHKYPIQDCRSGTCYKAYMWFNGYLGSKVVPASAGGTCTKNCVTGLPASYVPAVSPIVTNPNSVYYGTNEVQITAPNLNKGVPTNIAFDAGPQATTYYVNAFINGPWNWHADASLFKVFPITESVALRMNLDAFNVFNIQGYQSPAGNGVEEVQPGVGQTSSFWSPRQIQLTVRLNF